VGNGGGRCRGSLQNQPAWVSPPKSPDTAARRRRIVAGDWGEVSEEDRVENEVSLLNGYRLLSAYRTKMGERLWILSRKRIAL